MVCSELLMFPILVIMATSKVLKYEDFFYCVGARGLGPYSLTKLKIYLTFESSKLEDSIFKEFK